MNSTRLYTKPQSCPDDMKTLNSRGSGVQDKHITFRVPHDLQDMGMAADKDIRTDFIYQFSRPRVIPAGIAADMSHQHLHSLTFKETMQGMVKTKVMIITVARDTYQRLEFRNLARQVHSSAEIPSMPDLVHRLKKFTELLTEHSVRI